MLPIVHEVEEQQRPGAFITGVVRMDVGR